MRVLCTGSRNWRHHTAVWAVLDALAKEYVAVGETEMVVVHGAARGVDAYAESWVRLKGPHPLPVRSEAHHADWAKHGRRAGYIRNLAMTSRGADVCLAFLAPCESAKCTEPRPHWSHGTTQCMELAEAADIRTVPFYEQTEVPA